MSRLHPQLAPMDVALHEANAAVEHSPYMLRHSDQGKTTGIEFDVAVTTKETSGVKGGITVWGVGIGATAQDANEKVSHIRFTVEIRGHVL